MTNEQRHFTRIPFDASATITNSHNKTKFLTELIDISFKGLLISIPADWQCNNGEQYNVNLQLAGHDVEINLDVIEVHCEKNYVGFKTEKMDLDTATHLRRLVELNIADESLLEREFSELIQTS